MQIGDSHRQTQLTGLKGTWCVVLTFLRMITTVVIGAAGLIKRKSVSHRSVFDDSCEYFFVCIHRLLDWRQWDQHGLLVPRDVEQPIALSSVQSHIW